MLLSLLSPSSPTTIFVFDSISIENGIDEAKVAEINFTMDIVVVVSLVDSQILEISYCFIVC